MSTWPLGVFTSIDAGLGVKLDVAHELNIPTIQLHAPTRDCRTEARATEFLQRLERCGIELTAVFGGFAGESYADIPSVARTVGLVPPSTRAERLQEMKQISDFARRLNCSVIGLHVGFVPEQADHPDYPGIVAVTRELLDHARSNRQNLHLETGQESADALLQFIADVDRDNLYINFDPANMILYGTGEPLPALQQVGELVRSVHCKDARWSDAPGQTWGEEVPLGEGDVDISAYLNLLHQLGYRGPLTIEREIPQEPDRQKREISHAIELLTRCREAILV